MILHLNNGDANFSINHLTNSNDHSTTLIKFKSCVNIELATCIHLVLIVFFRFSSLKPISLVLEPSLTLVAFECHLEGPCFLGLQHFNHIQSITINANISVSLRWYNLPPYLIMSQMIIKYLCKHSLTTTSIHSSNHHLKLNLLFHIS